MQHAALLALANYQRRPEITNKYDNLTMQIKKPVSVTMTKKTASCRRLGRAIALGIDGKCSSCRMKDEMTYVRYMVQSSLPCMLQLRKAQIMLFCRVEVEWKERTKNLSLIAVV